MIALVEVVSARGSTPREAGAWMLVQPGSIDGTIGGGRLEQMAIERAREALRDGMPAAMDVPLGPEIGQCCGGRVELRVRVVDDALAAEIETRRDAERARQPQVYIFGQGHVGTALREALAPLPFAVTCIESRPDFAAGARLEAMPERTIREAPSGTSYVILTHDHALDLLLVDAALDRTNTPYVGLIGSSTKRATFRSKLDRPERMDRLVCPIGGADIRDKRPEVIAALVAAELCTVLLD